MTRRTVVWKYPLEGILPSGTLDVEMPEAAEIIHVQAQADTPTIWAEVDPLAPSETRRFRVLGTGKRIPKAERAELEYVGTVMLRAGLLVLHVYERRQP